MPLYKIIDLTPKAKLYLWKITEDRNTLFNQVLLKETSLERLNNMKSESHQKGFLAVRMLLQSAGYNDNNLIYDEFGKPHLKLEAESWKFNNSKKLETRNPKPKTRNPKPETQYPKHISISHSYGFSAIVISDNPIGLDIEILKEKTLKIAPRFMDISHLENLSEPEKIKKATAVWGIKECIFKIKNQAGISFPNHIFEDDFSFHHKKATATLKFNNKEEKFNIVFDSIEDYIFVCAFENNSNLYKL